MDSIPRRGRLRQEWRLLLMALQFLTRLPVGPCAGYEPASMRHAARHFPLVGALVGAFGAVLALATDALWPPTVAAALAVAGTVWLSAALHEDGLADTFDALLGAASRDKALAIMKDPRIGTYGAAALLVVLLLRVLLVAELLAHAPMVAAAALVASHAVGRTTAVALMASLPYARDTTEARADASTAKAGAIVRDVRSPDAARALAIGMLALALATWTQPSPARTFAAAVGGIALLLLTMRRWLQRRLAGYTGDTLGAAEQFGELAVLLAFAASGPG
jgi:adenosylcobinamide-GDP ribazoletransferase